MDIHEIVKKLVGNIDPVGETHTDNARFENLKVMTELVDNLLSDIHNVISNNKNAYESSRKKAYSYAHEFYVTLKDEVDYSVGQCKSVD